MIPRAASGSLDLRRRASVPVDRVFELVGIQIERTRQVCLEILLGHAEVDVEEEGSALGRRLGSCAVDERTQPRGMHQRLVARQLVDRQRVISRPGAEPTLEDADIGQTPRPQDRDQSAGVIEAIAIEDRTALGADPLLLEDPLDLRRVDGVEPLHGEREGTRDVATPGVVALAPAVVGAQRSGVDDGHGRIAEAIAYGRRRDGRDVGPGVDGMETGHEGPFEGRHTQKDPRQAGVPEVRSGVRFTRLARLDTPPALLGSRRTHTAAHGTGDGTHRGVV